MSDPITLIHHDGNPIPPLPILLDVKEASFKPEGYNQNVIGAEVLNGAYRYCWIQLHENIEHPLGYPAHPEIVAALSPPGLVVKLVAFGLGLTQAVEPRKAFVLELAFLPDKQGKRSIALDQGLVGRYRLEVIGPTLLDTTMLPDKYRERGIWSKIIALTITDQILIPLVGVRGDFNTVRAGGAISDVAQWERLLTLITTIFDLVNGIVRTLDAPGVGQGFTIFASNTCLAFADAIANPSSLPTATLQGKASSLRQMLEARGLHTLPSRVKFWVNTIELSAVIISLTGAHPVDNYLIDVPLRYRTSMAVSPDPLSVGVLQRPEFNLLVEWIERAGTAGGSAVRRIVSDQNLRFANARLVEEQDADGSVAPTLVLSDILYHDPALGLHLADLTLHIRVLKGTDGKRPMRPEGWNPEWGDGPVSLEFPPGGLGRLFRASEVASSTLSIRALNNSDYFPYPQAYRLSEETVPLDVMPAVISAYMQDTAVVDVGERTSIGLEFVLPDGTLFDVNQPFWAELEPLDDGERLRVSKIYIEVPDEWTEELVIRQVPLQLILEPWADDDERRLRLYLPEATELSLGLNLNYLGLGDLLGGRQSGFAELRVFVFGDNLPDWVTLEQDQLSCGVTVNAIELSAQISSLEGPDEDELTLEDTLLDGALVGSFDLTAEAGGQSLFSMEEDMLFEVEVEDDRLRIEKVWREDDNGDLQELPLRMHLVITDESIARFSMQRITGQAHGDFVFHGQLWDVVEAVAPGSTDLSLFLLPPTNSDEHDVLYDIASAGQGGLPILVPPPLQPSLESWQGDGQPLRTLGDTALEIIKQVGVLRGRVDEHREQSLSEQISLRIDSPGDTQQIAIWDEDEILDDIFLAGNGQLTLDIDDLNEGDNLLTLSAWKPIHEVMGLGTVEVSKTLQGVAPHPVEILGPADTITVLRRQIGPLTVQHGRSLATSLNARPPSGGGPELTFPGSYTTRTENPAAMLLEAETGNHQLRWQAENDFAISDDSTTVVAATPQISAANAQLGHSQTSHTLSVEVSGALQFRAERNGTQILSDAISSADGSASHQLSLDNLSVGNNIITLLAWNEFNESSPSQRNVNIHRRDNILSIISANLMIGVAGTGNDDRVVSLETEVVLDGGGSNYLNHGYAWRHDMSWPPSGDYGPNDMYRAEWRSYELDDDGIPVPDEFDVRIEFAGTGVDPDYNNVTLFMAIPLGVLEDNVEPVADNANGYAYSTGAVIRSDQANMIYFVYG